MKTFLMAIFSVTMAVTGCSGSKSMQPNTYAIIPTPVSLVEMKGSFAFTGKSKIIVSPLDSQTELSAGFIAAMINPVTGWSLKPEEGSDAVSGSLFLQIDTSVSSDEGYSLSVSPKKIILKAATPAGLFYGVQTIRQLLPPEIESGTLVENISMNVPACEIRDEPRFSYRGMHLDVSRHFFGVESVKKYIDMLALHKMNSFHWHLTDDQGWRIEIRKYPKLTETGAFRKETLVGHARNKPQVFDGKPYGGFYTQDEIREVVAYASERFITVIPEIEMPGHAQALLAAYPELSCTGGPFEVFTGWGIVEDIFCAGKEETFTLLEDVLTEVAELFPGEYIHIGGDEAPKVRWEKCAECQKRMKEEGLEDELELQSYFITRMEKFLISKGKRIIGWDEILEGGLAPEATVMSWRGTAGGIEAARQKHNVIMTPTQYAYLDYYQKEPEGEPLSIGGYVPLEKVYSFDPVPDELSADEAKYILGFQGNLWTEYIADQGHLEYMAFPRAFAIAETGWSPMLKKDFEDFLARLAVLGQRYEQAGITYFRGEYRDTRAAAR
ncbi:MAG: beta-N-acetylhexosaminidase [Bacteroidales bacterium]|jgi:hexosaminidase|nr:beta-N-acetylhexosaminidase [Bacteroidales bacterium]